MSFLQIARKTVCALLVLTPVGLVFGQTVFAPQGGEYGITAPLVGDQVAAAASVNASGGYILWHDNITDTNGHGVSAIRLDANYSATFSSFRVNEQQNGDQNFPAVSMLNGGGAAFVWQGGKQGFQKIYARFISAANTWLTGEVMVNSFTNNFQSGPVAATLTNGNVVVVWDSYNQVSASSYRDVYSIRFTPAGAKIGGTETLMNQATAYNQRTPSVAALSDGRYVVAWVSEQQRFENSVDIYARIFAANGTPVGGEFLVNTETNICANPNIAASANGGFLVGWTERSSLITDDSMDVMGRVFTGAGAGGVTRKLNTETYGDQFAPRVKAAGNDFLAVWTSLRQDGSYEGVFGKFLNSDGTANGSEFRVNSTTALGQKFPAIASDGSSRYFVAWSSFVGGANSMDLFAQRYAPLLQPLAPPDAPFVTTLSSSSLALSWVAQSGYSVANYEVYVDGATTPTLLVTNNWWTLNGLAAGSAHTFKLAYNLTDGRHSPLSASSSGSTYVYPFTWGGVPYDWMMASWGGDIGAWPSATADSDGDGASNAQEFFAGTNPLDASSVLKVAMTTTGQGVFLNWNSQPGLVYQVQSSANLGSWVNVGQPRVAAGAVDSMFVGTAGFYRVMRLR